MRLGRLLAMCLVLSSASGLAAVACSSAPARSAPLDTRPDRDKPDNDEDADENRAKPESDPPLPDGNKPPGRVFAHTADTLYLYDPLAKTLVKKGMFSCLKQNGASLDRVLDIAIDAAGVMYATSDIGFLKVTNPDTATCTYVKEDPTVEYPNSLAFVPMGTVDKTKETLVGYAFQGPGLPATVYVKIELATGVMTRVNEGTAADTLNPPGDAGTKYRSSGDLIAMSRNGNRAFLTVRKSDDLTARDFLAEVDPATGRLKAILGQTSGTALFGFGQWAGTGYGFSGTGEVVEINLENGASKTILTIDTDGGGWFGAGVTTDSPTKP